MEQRVKREGGNKESGRKEGREGESLSTQKNS
jgi:hypothetical protein